LIERKDLRDKLGKVDAESVKEKFAPDKMVDTIEEVYERIMKRTCDYEKLQKGIVVRCAAPAGVHQYHAAG
jgi:hypothetical protein